MKSLKQVGTVLHLSKSSGNLILKGEGDVKIGDNILNARGKKIGTVFDLFGPILGPFISVKPRIEAPERLRGEALFLGKKKR